jgi:hypothetical protein
MVPSPARIAPQLRVAKEISLASVKIKGNLPRLSNALNDRLQIAPQAEADGAIGHIEG